VDGWVLDIVHNGCSQKDDFVLVGTTVHVAYVCHLSLGIEMDVRRDFLAHDASVSAFSYPGNIYMLLPE
jgi:hypothetical protein